jgi:hypothetical protein
MSSQPDRLPAPPHWSPVTTPPPDEHPNGFGAPSAELERRADRGDGARAGAHALRLEVPPVPAPRHPLHDRLRYYLCCLEPSGEFDEVIVAVTDAGRRRYFATRDGERLAEVAEHAFERRSESGTRSMLELDERELGELEAELQFVRPVRGRDPIAEAAAEAEAEAEADAEAPAEAEAAADAEAPAVSADAAVSTDASVSTGVDETEVDETVDDESELIETAAESAVTVADTEADEAEPEAPEQTPEAPEPSADAPEPPADSTDAAGVDALERTARATDAELDDHGDDEDWIMEEFEAEMMTTTTDQAEPMERVEARMSARPAVATSVAPALLPVSTPSAETVAVAQVSLARGIAFVAHRGRLDKSGLPYVDHPGRVAERFDIVAEPIEAAAAWLHDVLEDTPITAQELLEAGVLPEIVDVVRLLTRTPDVSPDEYYARIRRHPSALAVKLADIDDNTAPWRLRRLSYGTQVRLAQKYEHARRALGIGD